ncbi:hypothetical protein OROHE_003066 [Orobanche hederae]
MTQMTGNRFCWSDNITKRLLDICIDEKENGYNKFDWQKLAQNLSVQAQMTFVARQVQNHYSDLKDKYKGMDDDVRRACMIVGLEQMRRLLQPPIESGPTSQPQPQRSGGETGAEYIHSILNGRPNLSKEQLRLHRDMFIKLVDFMVARKLLSDGRFIKDCIGALDGTHIKAVISDKDGVPFRGQKGTKTWNFLACCFFDRIFTFTNVGWEGSAHDMIVWTDFLTKSKYGFPHLPSGKYYLVDFGYPNTVGYLTPIKGKNVRYHITDFKKKRVLKGISEQSNYRHSSLRTTIERSFGQLKKRWKVLYVMPQMEDKYQIYVIVSTITLHNFMRMCKLGIPVLEHDVVEGGVDNDLLNPSRKEAMNKLRKEITLQIWRSIPGNVETREQEGNIELGDHLEQEQTSNIETDIEE